jgi:hypothetical protein
MSYGFFCYVLRRAEQTQRSETLATKLHTPENIPKENIRHSRHGESLKSRTAHSYFVRKS